MGNEAFQNASFPNRNEGNSCLWAKFGLDSLHFHHWEKFWHISEPTGITNSTQYVTGTFVYMKWDYLQNFFENGCSMRCLWASENQRNWSFDLTYWALRHNQNYPNSNLAHFMAWKTTFINGLRYFIHFWKSLFTKIGPKFVRPSDTT